MKISYNSPLSSILVGLGCLTAITEATAHPHKPTVVDSKHGVTYRGAERNGIEVFLNISYGQDTGGKNRFRPPKPHLPRRGSVIQADVFGDSCPQPADSALPGSNQTISENCLNLNIGRPKNTTPRDRLPVMVWIYGGSLWTGSASSPLYWPEGLVLESVKNGLPVIHVAMNYRLGVFGFGRSDYLTKEGSTNAGVRDQRLALEWVHDNIARFGGDPDKVTIFGQSSGGLSVGIQIMAYGGRKSAPFQQGICESQALEPGITSNYTIDAMKAVVDKLECSKGNLHSRETVACLRDLDMGTLLNASVATYTDAVNLGDIWLPFVDGDFIPDVPSKLIKEGRFANVTTAIGWCQDDLTLFVDRKIKTAQDSRRFVHNYAPGITTDNLSKLLSMYPIGEFTANAAANLSAEFYRTARVVRDMYMTCQPIYYAEHIAAAGNDVYLYNWNQTVMDPIWAAAGQPGLGVTHVAEIPYVYASLEAFKKAGAPLNLTKGDFELMDRSSRSWSTFASTGRFSLGGHDTFKNFKPAFTTKGNIDLFVAGGPNEGMSFIDGPGSKPAVRSQKLRQRCGFLNTPSMIEQLKY